MRRSRALLALAAAALCGVAVALAAGVLNPFGPSRLSEAIDTSVDGPPWLGFHDNWQIDDLQVGGVPADDPDQVILPTPYLQAEELGVNAYRFIVGWNTALPCTGAPNWSRYDNAYTYATASASRPVVVATVGGGDAPCHGYGPGDPPGATNPVNCTGAPPSDDDGRPSSYAPKADAPDYAASWKAFIANLAARMPDALAIEIWNEPNARHHWGYCDVSAGRYAVLVRQAQGALRVAKLTHPEISSDMAIAVAGLSPIGENMAADAEIFDWRVYLRKLADSGVTDPSSTPSTVDDVSTVVATHPYLRPDDCAGAAELEPAGAVDAQVDQARELVGDAPVWITEVGASTSGKPGGDCRSAVDEGDQARQLVDLVRMMRLKEVPVGILFRFATSTVEDDDPVDWFTEMGVLGQDFALRGDGSVADPYCALADELNRSPSLISCP